MGLCPWWRGTQAAAEASCAVKGKPLARLGSSTGRTRRQQSQGKFLAKFWTFSNACMDCRTATCGARSYKFVTAQGAHSKTHLPAETWRRAGPEADEDSCTAGVDETAAKAQRAGAERHSRADVPRSSTALSSSLWHPPRSPGPCRAFPVPVCCPRTPHTDCPDSSRSSSVVKRLPALRQSQKS